MSFADGDADPAQEALVRELRSLRKNPKRYGSNMYADLEGCYEGTHLRLPSGLEITTTEGIEALQECVEELQRSEPLPELIFSQVLSEACAAHVEDMQTADFCSHIGSAGSTPEIRISAVGEYKEQCGENLVFAMTSAKEIVYQMLLDDGTPERGHRANLLNADFHFVGVALGRHPSCDAAAVVMLADVFRAKQATRAQKMLGICGQAADQTAKALEGSESQEKEAQKAWDRLMQEVKPAHLAVPAKLLQQVQQMNRPELYNVLSVRPRRFALGALQAVKQVNPVKVRAFVHRLDTNLDDQISEEDIMVINHHMHLDLRGEDVSRLFDEVVERRQPGERMRRRLTWEEIFSAVRPQKQWSPVLDLHVVLEGPIETAAFQLTIETAKMKELCREVYDNYRDLSENLLSPSVFTEATGRMQVNSLNSFLTSLLQATVAGTTDLIQNDPQVQSLCPPGVPKAKILSAVCMGQRRQWAYYVRPHRDVWIRIMRAAGVNPLVALDEKKHRTYVAKLETLKDAIDAEQAKLTSMNAVRSSGAQPAFQTSEPRGKVRIEAKQVVSNHRPPWEEKRHHTEMLVNRCILASSTGSDARNVTTAATAPEMVYTFEARRQFQQAAAERSLRGGTALSKTYAGPGASSLSALAGVRSHFHNTDVAKAPPEMATHQNRWPQSLDVRLNGSHIDHSLLEPLRDDVKWSKLLGDEKTRVFHCYFGSGRDNFKLKLEAAENKTYGMEKYTPWSAAEFRADVAERHGKFGRRAFDPQVREKPIANRFNVSELESKPTEAFFRQQERLEECMDRALPQNQQKHFKTYLPRAEQPGRFHDLTTGAGKQDFMSGDQKTHRLGFAQNRHSDGKDLKLYTRPIGTSQMDRQLPMA